MIVSTIEFCNSWETLFKKHKAFLFVEELWWFWTIHKYEHDGNCNQSDQDEEINGLAFKVVKEDSCNHLECSGEKEYTLSVVKIIFAWQEFSAVNVGSGTSAIISQTNHKDDPVNCQKIFSKQHDQ